MSAHHAPAAVLGPHLRTSRCCPDLGGLGAGGLRLGETLDQILMCLHIKRSHINNSGIMQGSVEELRGDSRTLACGLGSISQDK